jgi:hypothetical protein
LPPSLFLTQRHRFSPESTHSVFAHASQAPNSPNAQEGGKVREIRPPRTSFPADRNMLSPVHRVEMEQEATQ